MTDKRSFKNIFSEKVPLYLFQNIVQKKKQQTKEFIFLQKFNFAACKNFIFPPSKKIVSTGLILTGL